MTVAPKSARMDWLTRTEALAILQCGRTAIGRMVAEGLIRRRAVPSHRRYWREDVERIAAPAPTAQKLLKG